MRNKTRKKKSAGLLLILLMMMDLTTTGNSNVTVTVPIHICFDEAICSACESEIEEQIPSYQTTQENNRPAA